MLSFINPSFSFEPFSTRYYRPEENVPFVEQNDTHWFVKVYLPDVAKEDFNVSMDDNKLLLKWMDYKKIRHNGRIFESRHPFNKSYELPSGITMDDIEVTWKENFAIVSIKKPPQKLVENQLSLNNCPIAKDGTIMKIPVPEKGDHSVNVNMDGNQLTVMFEASNKTQSENGSYSHSHTKMQRSMTVPDGIDLSNIDTNIENGELIVRLKELPSSSIPEIEDEKSESKKDVEMVD